MLVESKFNFHRAVMSSSQYHSHTSLYITEIAV